MLNRKTCTIWKADALVRPLRPLRRRQVLTLEVDIRERTPDWVDEGPSDAIGIGKEERSCGQETWNIRSNQDTSDFEDAASSAAEKRHVAVDPEERVDLMSIRARDVLDMDGRAEDVHTAE